MMSQAGYQTIAIHILTNVSSTCFFLHDQKVKAKNSNIFRTKRAFKTKSIYHYF